MNSARPTWTTIGHDLHTLGDLTLVVGDDSAALVVDGHTPPDAAELVAAVTDRPVSHVVLLAAGDRVDLPGARTVGHHLLDPLPEESFASVWATDLGSRRVEVLHLGGRSAERAVVVCPDLGAVIAGRQVEVSWLDEVDARPDAAEIPAEWPDAVLALVGLIRDARGSRPADVVVAAGGSVTDRGTVNAFGAMIDRIRHDADGPDADSGGPASLDVGDRPRLPLA